MKKWNPKKGEAYWTIGYYIVHWNRWGDDVHQDKFNFYFGNCFKTEKEAERIFLKVYPQSPL